MKNLEKTKETLVFELEEAQLKYNSLKEALEKEAHERENEKLLLEKLSRASEELIQFQDGKSGYNRITETLIEISGASYAVFNIFDHDGLGFTTVAIAGIKDIYKTTISYLGFDLINKHWPHDPEREAKTKDQTITRFDSLGQLIGGVMPKSVVYIIEKTFNIGATYVIKVSRDSKVIGDFTLLFHTGETILNSNLVNLYANQVGWFVERSNITNELSLSHAQHSAMVANIADVIGVVTAEGIIRYVSPNVEKWFGWEADKLVGTEMWPNVHPNDLQSIQKEFKGLLAKDNLSVTVDYMAKCGDGTYKPVRLTASNLVNNQIIQGILVNFHDISESRKAEKALLESRETYRSLVENISDVIFTLDVNGLFTYISPVIEQIIGLKPEAVIGQNFSTFVHPDDLPELMRSMGETMKGLNSPFEFRATYQGKIRYVRTSSHLTFQDGVVTGLNGIMTDITKRYEAEIALKSKTALLEAQVETTIDGILVIDNDKRIGLTNKRLIELFDIPAHIVDEKDSHSLINLIVSQALYPERLYEKVKQIIVNEQLSCCDELECVNGKVLDWYSAPIKGKDGTSYGRIWIFHDITERKKAQDQLLKSEIRYRSLFQNSPSGILIVDQNGIILEANQAFTDITLYSTSELVGSDIRMLTLPENHYLVEKHINRILSGEVLELEVLSKRKDGSFCTLLLREIAIILPNGSKGVLSVSNDISQRKKIEKDLAIKNEELSETVAEKDKFFSIISHDLRSPFNGFLGLTQMMADGLPNMTLDEIQTVAISMRKSAANLYRLLENLLEWSRMEQGLIPFSPIKMKLDEIVGQSVQTLLEPAKNKNISIAFNIPDDIEIFADSNTIEAVIRNLVSNAIKFTTNGGKVGISAKITDQKSIEISVKDTGIGMKPEILDKLFQITGNISRKGTDDEPSTGLGLFLCKGFIEKHGGSIWAESEEGKGSVFHFSIPIG